MHETNHIQEPLYMHSVLIRELGVRRGLGLPVVALFSDIDRTFITYPYSTLSNDQGAAAVAAQADSEQLASELRAHDVPFTYVTGNGVEQVVARMGSGELPLPSALVTAVGTEIYVQLDDTVVPTDLDIPVTTPGSSHPAYFRPDESYQRYVAGLGYDRSRVMEQGQAFVDRLTHEDQFYGQGGWRLHFQPGGAQPYKVSFYFFASSLEQVTQLTEAAKEEFDQQVVVCEEIGYNSQLSEGQVPKKYCLDVVPITKRGAVDYLVSRTGIDYAITAADSGNDKSLVDVGDVAIVVGGARPELLDYLLYTYVNRLDVTGRSSFRTIAGSNGTSAKLIYRGRDTLLGPSSIRHALSVLNRAFTMYGDK